MHSAWFKFASIGVYLVFVAWLGAMCANLANYVAPHAVKIAYQAWPQRPDGGMSRVERQKIRSAAFRSLDPEFTREELMPAGAAPPPSVLAAQIDLAEQADLVGSEVVTRPTGSRRAGGARTARKSAAEIFGRSFGVVLMASR